MNNERDQEINESYIASLFKKLFDGANWSISASFGLNIGVLEGTFVMIPSGYSLCWYIFYLCYLKKEDRDIGYNSTVNSFLQTRGLSISGKWPAFREDLKFYILGRGLQPPGVFFKGIAGSTADLQIVFLEPLDKMCADILQSVYHDRSLYLLFFLYQNIFSVVLQEL